MTCSPARLAANQRNALLSTGPRTAEGKERSRANALKHGLTGDGVVLTTEGEAEVAALAAQLEAELNPTGAMGRILLKRAAVLAVRLDRCVEQSEAMAAQRVREADRAYEAARYAEVEALGAGIAASPAATVRALKQTREGIEWLIRAWLAVKGELLQPKAYPWGLSHRIRIEHLLGRGLEEYPPSRFDGVAVAVMGIFTFWDEGRDTLKPRERRELARQTVAAMIDAEVAALRDLERGRSDEEEARNRAEAPKRALFDPSQEGQLARKYEVATERGLFRTLREFQQVQKTAVAVAAPEPVATTVPPAESPVVRPRTAPAPHLPAAPIVPAAPSWSVPAHAAPSQTNPTPWGTGPAIGGPG